MMKRPKMDIQNGRASELGRSRREREGEPLILRSVNLIMMCRPDHRSGLQAGRTERGEVQRWNADDDMRTPQARARLPARSGWARWPRRSYHRRPRLCRRARAEQFGELGDVVGAGDAGEQAVERLVADAGEACGRTWIRKRTDELAG